jgi:hypothetical protein
LEIGISDIDEMIASKHAARNNLVLHEYAEDLASYIFIRCHIIRPLLVWQRRSHKLNATASRDWTYTVSSARRRGNPMAHRRNKTALPHRVHLCDNARLLKLLTVTASCHIAIGGGRKTAEHWERTMAGEFQVMGTNAAALFTLKLHRGDGMCLVAMNWKNGKPPNDFQLRSSIGLGRRRSRTFVSPEKLHQHPVGR